MKHYGLEIPEGTNGVTNLTAPTGTAFPAMENAGELFFRTDQNRLYVRGTSSWLDITDVGTFAGPLALNDGSASAPSYSFSSSTDSGMYSDGSGNLGFSVDGTEELKINTDAITWGVNKGTLTSYESSDTDITALIPGSSFGSLIVGRDNGHIAIGVRANDGNDGFHVIRDETPYGSYNELLFSATGTQITAGKPIRGTDGGASAPAYSFDNDNDTGIYSSGANELSFTTGGTERVRIEANGTLHAETSNYETLVTDDDDIPNKKYVDDAITTETNGVYLPLTGGTMLGTLDMGSAFFVGGRGPNNDVIGIVDDINFNDHIFAWRMPSDDTDGSSIDHMWHDPSGLTHFVSSGTRQQTGNSIVVGGEFRSSLGGEGYTFWDNNFAGVHYYTGSPIYVDLSVSDPTVGTNTTTIQLSLNDGLFSAAYQSIFNFKSRVGPNDVILRLLNSTDDSWEIKFDDSDSNNFKIGYNGSTALVIETNGTLSVSGTTNYENLVTNDDDIPNKKYVDDAINSGIGSPHPLYNVVEDTSPQLGGTLDGNSQVITSLDEIQVSDGSVSDPSYTFTNDLDTGLYSVGADQLGFATNGTLGFYLDTNQNINFQDHVLYNALRIRTGDGSAALPSHSFTDDTDIGMYRSGANELAFSTGGLQGLRITSDGDVVARNSLCSSDATTNTIQVGANDINLTRVGGGPSYISTTESGGQLIFRTDTQTTALTLDSSQNATFEGVIYNTDGTAGAPSYSFTDDTDTGMYRSGANELAFSIAGARRGYFTSGGDFVLEGDNDVLQLKGEATGNSNIVYMEWLQSNDTRVGYIGDAATGDEHIRLTADIDELRLQSETATRFYTNGATLALTLDSSQNATFEGVIYNTDGTAGAPSYSFTDDTDTGIYRSSANELSFTTGGTERLRIESNGTIQVHTANYENLVTIDDDIPNKKYVDDNISPALPVSNYNVIGNPSFSVQQRGDILTAPVADGEIVFDRWRIYYNGSMQVHSEQVDSTDIPQDVGGIAPKTSGRIITATADTSIASGDFIMMGTGVMVEDLERYYDQNVVLSFLVRSNYSGTFCVAVRSPDNTYTYVKEFTTTATGSPINGDDWEKKNFSFMLDTSSGDWSWTKRTEGSIRIFFTMAAGSTYHTTANSWNSGVLLSTSSQSNYVGATDRFFEITSVKLERGTTPTAFVNPEWSTEYMKASRYHWRTYPYGIRTNDTSTAAKNAAIHHRTTATAAAIYKHIPFDVEMRDVPSVETRNPDTGSTDTVRNITTASNVSVSSITAGTKGVQIVTLGSSQSSNQILRYHIAATAEVV